MVLAPTGHILPPTPGDIAVHRGRKSTDEIEAAHPVGRVMHRVEGLAYGISSRSVHYRATTAERVLHDAEHDRYLEMALRAVRDGDMQAVRGLIRAAQQADEREDACSARGDEIVLSIHELARSIAGLCERVCSALVERVRGQRSKP